MVRIDVCLYETLDPVDSFRFRLYFPQSNYPLLNHASMANQLWEAAVADASHRPAACARWKQRIEGSTAVTPLPSVGWHSPSGAPPGALPNSLIQKYRALPRLGTLYPSDLETSRVQKRATRPYKSTCACAIGVF